MVEEGDPRKLIVYSHCRVVFGVNASPFLLAAAINYHLDNVAESQKGIAAKLKESMYVDNCVASVNTIGELNSFIKVSKELMASAQFDLRGWKHNRPEGPDWLKLLHEEWPASEIKPDMEIVISERRRTVLTATTLDLCRFALFQKISSFNKVVRIMAYVIRFCKNVNPPAATWWGGFWERLIGLLKSILRKVLGRAYLSEEKLVTVLCDAESLVNSRPLTLQAVSTENSDIGRVVAYRASTPQVWGSLNGLGKVDSAFHPRYIGSINEYQACLGS
ncbi:DUF5641 domain-containing protein [Trichonephila clavipes]|nr:DUF5641 domain-containing protein [Trichonephila clavipes]